MATRTTRRSFTGARRLAVALPAIAGLALAAAPRLASGEPDPPSRPTVEYLAAHAVARVAILDLITAGNPNQRDYKINQELLGIASNLAHTALQRAQTGKEPGSEDDQTILRLYLEAATAAEDTRTIAAITRRLLKIDPDDTVSQLRLIGARISELQTADDRLAAYDKFLGEEGTTVDDSVRSRLALDAALLCRERGDIEGFKQRLYRALELDRTNKDAATLGLAFYSQGRSDPDAILDWQFAILGADPFDSQVYSAIVQHLLSNGAYKGAMRIARVQHRLSAVQGRPLGSADETAYDLAEWNTDGPEAVIRRLSESLDKARLQAFEQRKQAMEQGKPLDALPTPETTHLPLGRERSRVLCAVALNDRERIAVFLRELDAAVRSGTRDALDPLKRPRGVSQEDALAAVRGAELEFVWMRLLGGQFVKEAVKDLEDLKSDEIPADMAARLDAWVEFRTGDQVKAREKMEAIAPTDPFAAFALAQMTESSGDSAAAIRQYTELARRAAGDAPGAIARTRYAALAGEALRPTEEASTLDANVAGAPDWLESIVDNPRKVMALEVTPLRTEIIPIERTPVRVTLRNTSPIPLAMGPDKLLNTRLLFAPSVDMGTVRMPTTGLSQVASMDRRLRMLPNQSLDVIAWPDIGQLSFAMELMLPKQARVRWRVLQGFEAVDLPNGDIRFDSAPQCLSADVPMLFRRVPNRAEAVFESLQLVAQTGGAREMADMIISLVLQIVQQKALNSQIDADALDRIMEALARRFPTLERSTRILTLCLVPTASNAGQITRLDQVAATDPDEDVLAVELAARVYRKDDPIFASRAVLNSPRLTALAQLVQERLQAEQPTYSTSPITKLAGKIDLPEGAGGALKPPGSPATAEPKTARPIIVPPNPTPIPTIQ